MRALEGKAGRLDTDAGTAGTEEALSLPSPTPQEKTHTASGGSTAVAAVLVVDEGAFVANGICPARIYKIRQERREDRSARGGEGRGGGQREKENNKGKSTGIFQRNA